MHWYKHSTDSHDDPDISDAMDEFGPSGYTAFFIALEIYGREFNKLDKNGWLTLSVRFFARKLRLSSIKVEKIFNFYSGRQRIDYKIHENRISFIVPQFIEIASNWVKRSRPQPTEDLQRPTVAPTAKEAEEETKKLQYSEAFVKFWNYYPRKIGKGAAYKSWKRIPKENGLLNSILKAISIQKQSEQWKKDNGQFIPHPATWLNQRRWEDEGIDNKPKMQRMGP